jgi:membrane protease YdiL (CAAX protease family)
VRPFNPAVTVICTLLLIMSGIFSLVGSAQGTQYFEGGRQPLALTAQYFDREMEMAEVPSQSLGWARLAIEPVSKVHEAAIRGLGAALEAHAQGKVEAPPEEVRLVEGRLAMVLAEAGKQDLLPQRLSTLAASGSEGARLAALVRFAYGLSDEPPAPEQLQATLRLLTEPARPSHTWATDRLASRALRRLGQEAEASAADARIGDRGARALWRDLGLSALLAVLILVGLVLGLIRLVSRRPLPLLSSGVSPAPWTSSEGYAMAVRAIIFSQAGFLCVPDYSAVSWLLGSLIGWLPMLYYLTRRVPAVHGTGLSELFGLKLQAPVAALLVATLVLIAIEQTFAVGLGLVGQRLDPGRWYEGVQEDLMRGSPAEAAGFFVAGVLGAPLFEEIALRGLVYTSLRIRFGPWASALISAALFSLLHVYSPVAALILLAGAVASALVYERTRSLLPCILAHLLNNAVFVGANLLVFRGA